MVGGGGVGVGGGGGVGVGGGWCLGVVWGVGGGVVGVLPSGPERHFKKSRGKEWSVRKKSRLRRIAGQLKTHLLTDCGMPGPGEPVERGKHIRWGS